MPLNERTVNSARNPRWSNHAQTTIDLEVDFDELDEVYVDFTADPNDICSWGSDLYNRAVAGEFGAIAAWQAPADITGEEAMTALREWRDNLLSKVVDPIVSNPLRWEGMTAEKQQEWRDYRQALLDVPATQSTAYMTFSTTEDRMVWANLTMPTKPE